MERVSTHSVRRRLSKISLAALSAQIALGSFAAGLFPTAALAVAPLCNGLSATIYVEAGFVVGGPLDGVAFGGTLTGTSGVDVIVGTSGNDVINALGGNDTVCSGTGSDTVDLGDGTNYLEADGVDNNITAGNGNDTIITGDGNHVIDAGNGTNNITTGNGDQDITGGSGNDTIFAGDGDHIIDAGNGTNIITVGNGNHQIDGGSGNDTIVTGNGDQVIDAGNGTNNITTGDGDDQITGGSGNDTINSDGGNDDIIAGNGTNIVNAGDGNDTITGGSGNDQLNGGSGNDACQDGNGSDTVSNCETMIGGGNEAMLVIRKNSLPNNTGEFDFTGSPAIGAFSVDGSDLYAYAVADPGSGAGTTYTVTESAEAGWTLTDVTCTVDTDTSGNVGTSSATIKLNRGDFIVCTFTNEEDVVDSDVDGEPDVTDNCPDVYNPGQEDTFEIGDGFGDACSSQQTIVVTPSTPDDWTITDEGAGASHEFVFGPATPPLGDGSLLMTITNGTDYSIARNLGYGGTRLDEITDLSYDTYVSSFVNGQAPVLSLRLDNDGDDDWDETIYFEPVYQTGGYSGDAVPNQCVGNEATCAILDTWQHWDALNGGWWLSTEGFSGPPLKTIQSYLVSYPDAKILDEGGFGGVRVFAGAGIAVTGNFDNVSLKVNGDRTTYDFDPDPAVCGDSVIEGGEMCDDGNTDNGDGCDASCQVEPPPTCNGLTATVYVQGGVIVGGPNDGDPYTGSLVGELFAGDVIVGTSGNDSILGLGGHDTVCGMGGNDSIYGGTGNDWIDGGDNIDLCVGGFGSNTVNNCEGSNALGGIIVIEKDAQPDAEDDFAFSGYYNPLP